MGFDVTRTLAESYVHHTAIVADHAAELASARNRADVQTYKLTHVPTTGFEAMGPIRSSGLLFFN